jgi:ssDNA-binding Zn-finger/Zn-ribbon topoisomerase 1
MATVADTNRFQDKNLRISDFADETFVECPKCEKRAVITKDDPSSYFSERTLKCPSCFYSLSGRHQSFSVTLNCHCSHCAAELKVDMKNVNEKKDSIAVRCSNCGKTERYEPRNESQEWYFKGTGKPSEGYFGLPFWLVENFRGNNFLAFNYKHLEYLKQYISADLRERNNRTHWTMVEKLPVWMKSAKNRDKLIKLITELERK